MKKRSLFSAVVGLAAIAGLTYAAVGNPIIAINNKRLKVAIQGCTGKQANLSDLVPFPWEACYVFSSEMSKESVEQAIGARSSSIRDDVPAGAQRIYFVRHGMVVAALEGFPSVLGVGLKGIRRTGWEDYEIFDVSRDIIGTVTLTRGEVLSASADEPSASGPDREVQPEEPETEFVGNEPTATEEELAVEGVEAADKAGDKKVDSTSPADAPAPVDPAEF